MKNKKVIVGMSGGVDSSVTAWLLKKEGYDVSGLFMKNWEEEPGQDHNCSADQDLIDAQSVSLKLGIRLHTVNFSVEYWDHVFTYFLEEYRAGRTPNPDVMCNKEIKFKAFLDYAKELGADYIATGHYARNVDNELYKGLDVNKDQSYFLHRLTGRVLENVLFPLGEIDKPAVREFAEKAGFKNAKKKDSTGICFIGERNFRQFLNQYLPAQPGEMRTPEGAVVGSHMGLMYYTLGQRQGLGIGGQKQGNEEPWYVVGKSLEDNVLIVAQGHHHPLLYTSTVYGQDLHWINPFEITLPFECHAKTRYRQKDQACTIVEVQDDKVTVLFSEPQWAVTPGQSIVFYQGELCLGGAIISYSL